MRSSADARHLLVLAFLNASFQVESMVTLVWTLIGPSGRRTPD